MLHRAKGEFIKVLERSSAQTGFPLRLLEKDYYITIKGKGLFNIDEILNALNRIFKKIK